MFIINGLQKSTLIDFPKKIASIVFSQGCNFRCGYCHNPELLSLNIPKTQISTEEVLSFLKTRKGKLDGVVVTGGEPTLQSGLYNFIKEIKAMGFLVKLDSNGSNPKILEKLINDNLLDYIAMDIKAPLEKYSEITNVKVNTDNIQKSINLIMNSDVDYEFRTTVIKSQLSFDDFENIGKQLFFLDTQINNLIDLMQCEIKEVDGFKNIVKKEEVANIENAFDNSNRPIKNKFYEYIQTSNRTNLERKREILSSISNDWDGIKNSIKNDSIRKQIIDDLSFLLNNFNIRHNNNDNNNIAKTSEKELIGIYDIVYKYFLYVYTLFNVQELNCEVEKIKKKYNFR